MPVDKSSILQNTMPHVWLCPHQLMDTSVIANDSLVGGQGNTNHSISLSTVPAQECNIAGNDSQVEEFRCEKPYSLPLSVPVRNTSPRAL